MTKTKEVNGFIWTIVYFIQRFIVFTINLRWALDPDRYDLDRNIKRAHLGLWKKGLLIGGARIIFPEEVEHTLTFSEEPFRAMLSDEVAETLRQNRRVWVEVTRLYVLGNKKDRAELAKALFRGIYQYGMEEGYPVLLMVVNDTLLTMFRRYRFAYKIVGAAGFMPANDAEQARVNESGLVAHYVVVLNLAVSQDMVASDTLTYFNEGLKEFGDMPEDHDVCTLWNSLPGLSPVDVKSLVHIEPSESWVPDAVAAATAGG